MNYNAIRMFLALSAACLSGSALSAQTYRITAEIPFAFHVNDNVQPAGKYLLAEKSGAVHMPAMTSVADGRSVFVIGANQSLDTVRNSGTKVVFHCYSGNGCFLAEIWPGNGLGTSVPKSRTEKEILKDRSRELATIAINAVRAD